MDNSYKIKRLRNKIKTIKETFNFQKRILDELIADPTKPSTVNAAGRLEATKLDLDNMIRQLNLLIKDEKSA